MQNKIHFLKVKELMKFNIKFSLHRSNLLNEMSEIMITLHLINVLSHVSISQHPLVVDAGMLCVNG